MGANVTQVPGATEVEIYFRNYSYATALSDMDPLEFVLFTDLDKCGYKNAAGSLHKFLEDASGSSNIPANSILFTDANGRATYDPSFTFDGTSISIGSWSFPYGWELVITPLKFALVNLSLGIEMILAESEGI